MPLLRESERKNRNEILGAVRIAYLGIVALNWHPWFMITNTWQNARNGWTKSRVLKSSVIYIFRDVSKDNLYASILSLFNPDTILSRPCHKEPFDLSPGYLGQYRVVGFYWLIWRWLTRHVPCKTIISYPQYYWPCPCIGTSSQALIK
jgi:hypothetical protein